MVAHMAKRRVGAQATALSYLPSFRLEFASYSKTLAFNGPKGDLRCGSPTESQSIDVQQFVVACIEAIAQRGAEAVHSAGLAEALCAKFVPSLLRSVRSPGRGCDALRLPTVPSGVPPRHRRLRFIGKRRRPSQHSFLSTAPFERTSCNRSTLGLTRTPPSLLLGSSPRYGLLQQRSRWLR